MSQIVIVYHTLSHLVIVLLEPLQPAFAHHANHLTIVTTRDNSVLVDTALEQGKALASRYVVSILEGPWPSRQNAHVDTFRKCNAGLRLLHG